ncbi:IS110 family transposase [Parabacteroides goldsteinii]|uniref:IS110 family transposase n=1 Tax=Parabacteroides goldsteinii TaxID=328812 RepID=UPI0034A3C320
MKTVPFEQVILRGCGIDVHKDMVVATISGEGLKTETRSYKTFSSSLTELKEWLLSSGITHVAMESTGVYWKPVYKILECPDMKVWIVNARHIKYVPGHKTDKKDSAWICKLLLAGLLKPSYIPEREQRELRDLTRYRNKLIQHVSSEKNRIVRILEDCNIKLSSVVCSLDGVVANKLIDMLIDKGHVTMDDITCIYHKKLEASPELLYQACEGFIEPHHIYMLQTIRKDMEQTKAIIADLTCRIKEVLSPYENVMELLQKIPGLSRKTVEDLIAEIGVDMEAFPTEKHLAAWAATRTKNTFYSARYHRLAARRGKKRALVAVGHSILKSVWHVLKEACEYKELGAEYLNQRMEQKRKNYLKKELEALDYKVKISRDDGPIPEVG